MCGLVHGKSETIFGIWGRSGAKVNLESGFIHLSSWRDSLIAAPQSEHHLLTGHAGEIPRIENIRGTNLSIDDSLLCLQHMTMLSNR